MAESYAVEGKLDFEGEHDSKRGPVYFWTIGDQKFSTFTKDPHLSDYEGQYIKTELTKKGQYFNYEGAAINKANPPRVLIDDYQDRENVLDEYKNDYCECLNAATQVAKNMDAFIVLSPSDVKDIATTFFIQKRNRA